MFPVLQGASKGLKQKQNFSEQQRKQRRQRRRNRFAMCKIHTYKYIHIYECVCLRKIGASHTYIDRIDEDLTKLLFFVVG